MSEQAMAVRDSYVVRITREQIPSLNDALYEGVEHADPEDRPAAEAFRDDLRAQLHGLQLDVITPELKAAIGRFVRYVRSRAEWERFENANPSYQYEYGHLRKPLLEAFERAVAEFTDADLAILRAVNEPTP